MLQLNNLIGCNIIFQNSSVFTTDKINENLYNGYWNGYHNDTTTRQTCQAKDRASSAD